MKHRAVAAAGTTAAGAVADVSSTPHRRERGPSPAATWTSGGRLAAAGTLVAGASFQLASIVIEPEADRTVDALRWTADHPDQANLARVLFLLAIPFLVGTALVYVMLARQHSPRLAHAGGALFGCGMVGLSAVAGYETLAAALTNDGRFDLTALAEVVDGSSPPAVAMLLIFVPFAFFGLLASAAALWRSRAVPRGAALLIATFILVDFFLNEGLGVVPSSGAHAIGLVAACWIAWSLLTARRADVDSRDQGSMSLESDEGSGPAKRGA
jgi:hypothetical protein